MSKTWESWPSWAPASLVQVYEELSRAPDAEWIGPEYPEWGLLFAEHPREYPAAFIGIGKKNETLGIVRRLCTDERMKIAWNRLQNAMYEATPLQSNSVAVERATDLQLLAAHIAMRAVHVLSDAKGEVSRAEWTSRFTRIAEHAGVLANLLENNASLVDDLDRFGKHYFTDDEWEGACEELAGESAANELEPWTDEEAARDERRDKARRNGLEPEPLTEMEISKDAEFEAEIKGWTDWYRWRLDRSLKFLSVSGALRILHERASRIAQSPPFVPKGPEDARRLANLSHTLSHVFMTTFGSPLDEVVATIVEVATGQDVSTDSVKMRRKRLRDHYRKDVK